MNDVRCPRAKSIDRETIEGIKATIQNAGKERSPVVDYMAGVYYFTPDEHRRTEDKRNRSRDPVACRSGVI
jgi:hypothetical protein